MAISETGKLSTQECDTPGCYEKTNEYYDTETMKSSPHKYGAACDCFYNYLMTYTSKKQEEIKITPTIFDF